jgi:hypothetical protein
MASQRVGDPIFRPWAINTLAILALKGAPATRETIQAAGGLVLVINPEMQKIARTRLQEIVTKEEGKTKEFVAAQEEWVKAHDVYGERESMR